MTHREFMAHVWQATADLPAMAIDPRDRGDAAGLAELENAVCFETTSATSRAVYSASAASLGPVFTPEVFREVSK